MSKICRKAFSLIEISLVIFIISLITLSIMVGSNIIQSTKLSSAINASNSSVVNSIPGLKIWLDATSSYALRKNEIDNDLKISQWKSADFVTREKFTFLQSSESLKPEYKKNFINHLPALHSSSATMLESKYKPLNKDATFFLVIKNPSNPGNRTILVGSNRNFQIAIINNIAQGIQLCYNMSGCLYSHNQSNFPKPGSNSIISIKFKSDSSDSNALSYFINGEKTPISHSTSGLFFNKTSSELKLSFNDIAIGEIIIFDRYLNENRRKSVESYLSKKWGIKILS